MEDTNTTPVTETPAVETPAAPAKSKPLTPTVVAAWFNVSAQTLRNIEPKLATPIVRTPGGHRRYTLVNVKEFATLMGVETPKQATE